MIVNTIILITVFKLSIGKREKDNTSFKTLPINDPSYPMSTRVRLKFINMTVIKITKIFMVK